MSLIHFYNHSDQYETELSRIHIDQPEQELQHFQARLDNPLFCHTAFYQRSCAMAEIELRQKLRIAPPEAKERFSHLQQEYDSSCG